MGMIGYLRAATPEELAKLRKKPASVKQFLFGKTANQTDMMAALQRIQQIAVQAKAKATTPEATEKARAEILRELEAAGIRAPGERPAANGLRLEKSWHSLHYLLTGSAEPVETILGRTILGGKEIGPDLGYGPARFLTPDEVRDLAAAMEKVSKDDLANRFDLKAMKAVQIYACADESELDLAQHYFGQVKDYYRDAASRGDAMLLYIA